MRIGLRLIIFLCCVCGALSGVSDALAQEDTFKREREALALITEFADKLCKEVPLSGGSESRELSGKAKAELKGLAKQIADLGFEGAATSKDDTYQGVLQTDLEGVLKENTDCRREVFRNLSDRFLGAKAVQPSSLPAPGEPADRQQDTSLRHYPIKLAAGASAKAAHAKYTILAATLDQHSTDKLNLKLTIRFTNDGDAWTDRTVMAENFRLRVGDIMLAPESSINETVATEGTKEGDVEFLIPASATAVVLRVGRPEYGTAEIPIDLTASN